MINTQLTADHDYYHKLRMPLIRLARGTPERVLEVGCAAGQTLSYFKSRGTKYAAGIEIVPEVAALAKKLPEIDDVILGNIETLSLSYPENSFDLVIAGHVLEHVTDPWAVLRKLHTYMAPGGQLIGSLPNVRNAGVTLPLLFAGKWDYTNEGILDWTHFRFFTRRTVQNLLTSTGFKVDLIEGELGGRKATLANLVTLNLLRDLWAFTNNFSATKATNSAV